MIKTKEVTGEYKLLNRNMGKKKKSKACKRHQWKQNKGKSENLKENIRKLAFGIGFAFLFFFPLKKKIQFNLFLVLHFKKVHQNTDIFFS